MRDASGGEAGGGGGGVSVVGNDASCKGHAGLLYQ